MTTNAQVRQAVVTALESVPKLNRYPHPVDAINTPAAVVAGFEFTELSFGGGRDITAKILVVVSRSDVSQLQVLDTLLDESGQGSVLEAINSRAADDISLMVTSVGDYGIIEWGDVAYYGAIVTVRVLA